MTSSSSLEEEAALAAALAESAALHSATVLSPAVDAARGAHALARGDVRPALGAAAARASRVTMRQVGVLNQFHKQWAPLIGEFGAPSAICGYTSVAHAAALAARGRGGEPRCFASPAEARAALLDFGAVEPLVRDAMARVRAARESWVAAHPDDFDGERARKLYTGAWVANYEVSDCLRALPAELARQVIFVRFNQYQERGVATHEERERMAEEQQFEGRAALFVEAFARVGGGGDSGGGDAAAAAAVLDRRLLTPEEALALPAGERADWRVAVVDLNGHFCVGVPLRGDDGAETLLLLNTIETSVFHGNGALAAAVCFDVLVGSAP